MASQTRSKSGKDNVTKETDSKTTAGKSAPAKAPAKKAAKAKEYRVLKQVPGVFESDDGKIVVFHEVGATVAAGGPGVDRALELWPDNFVPA